MLGKPSVLIPIAPGTNRNDELAQAFALAGADPVQVPLHALRQGEKKLRDVQLLALPGGFSYGDALGAGQLWAQDLTTWFADQLHLALEKQMPIVGICNGFQALTAAGLLPGGNRSGSLVANQSGRFECRWVTLQPNQATNSVWLDGLTEPLRCPVAHGEGRYVSDEPVAGDATSVDRLDVAFRYATPDGESAGGVYPHNPNGSAGDVAGVVDETGLILGLMPHPEDHVMARQDPLRGRGAGGSCLPLFANAVIAARQ